MSTQVTSPVAKPFTPPVQSSGTTPDTPPTKASVPSPGTLLIPSQVEQSGTDTFSPTALKAPPNTPVNNPKFGSHSQPKFGSIPKALGYGGIGFASAAICWPLAFGAGLLGLLIHPLLPVAGLLAIAPFALGALGGIMGARSK